MLGTYSHFESMQMGLETFFQDADKGKQKFEELRKLSNETTFGVDELTNSFTQLANVGVNVDTINDKLVMLGNIANGDKNKFADLVSVYSKIMSTGKAGSMQLQQLAMRGVPIYDMLKKIGVQGTATGEDITKAFQEMTKEGGQFYNAMENINKTIEGKEGFISDYFREMSVNLMEVTGLADAYKKVLDLLKDAIGKVSDKLLEWNQNPVAKAIVRGVLVTAIAGITTAIMVNLIPALIAVIQNLITINALSGPTGWTALAVAGIAGATTALVAYKNAVKETVAEEKQLGKIEPMKGSTSPYLTFMENDMVSYIKQNIQDLNNQLKDAREEAQKYKDTLMISDNNKGTLLELSKKNYSAVESELAKVEKEIEGLEKRQKSYNLQMEGSVILAENLETARKSQIVDEVDFYNKQIKALKEYKNIGQKTVVSRDEKGNYLTKIFELSDEEKKNIDTTIEYFEKKFKEATHNAQKNKADAWMNVLQDMIGFDDDVLFKLMKGKSNGGLTGGDVMSDYLDNISKSMANRKKIDEAFGLNSAKNYVEEEAKEIIDIINNLADTGLFGLDEKTGEFDKTLQALNNRLSDLRSEYEQTGGDMEVWDALMGNLIPKVDDLNNQLNIQKDIWDELSDNISDYLHNLGLVKTDADSFGRTLTDIVHTQLPNSLVDSFATIGASFDNMADAGEAIKKNFQQFVASALKSLSITCLQAGVSLIAQSGWAGVPPALALFALGGVGGLASGFVGSLGDTSQNSEHINQVKDLTDSYKDLIKAIKEQEEYYIRKKAELNMLALDDKVTKVNDMILSPHGAFSTNPNDTIIATKNPQGLGGVTNNIKVINNAGVNVDVRENKGNGLNEIIVNISRKIASDVAEGLNGWDGAMALQQQRISGRRI